MSVHVLVITYHYDGLYLHSTNTCTHYTTCYTLPTCTSLAPTIHPLHHSDNSNTQYTSIHICRYHTPSARVRPCTSHIHTTLCATLSLHVRALLLQHAPHTICDNIYVRVLPLLTDHTLVYNSVYLCSTVRLDVDSPHVLLYVEWPRPSYYISHGDVLITPIHIETSCPTG